MNHFTEEVPHEQFCYCLMTLSKSLVHCTPISQWRYDTHEHTHRCMITNVFPAGKSRGILSSRARAVGDITDSQRWKLNHLPSSRVWKDEAGLRTSTFSIFMWGWTQYSDTRPNDGYSVKNKIPCVNFSHCFPHINFLYLSKGYFFY